MLKRKDSQTFRRKSSCDFVNILYSKKRLIAENGKHWKLASYLITLSVHGRSCSHVNSWISAISVSWLYYKVIIAFIFWQLGVVPFGKKPPNCWLCGVGPPVSQYPVATGVGWNIALINQLPEGWAEGKDQKEWHNKTLRYLEWTDNGSSVWWCEHINVQDKHKCNSSPACMVIYCGIGLDSIVVPPITPSKARRNKSVIYGKSVGRLLWGWENEWVSII